MKNISEIQILTEEKMTPSSIHDELSSVPLTQETARNEQVWLHEICPVVVRVEVGLFRSSLW